MNHHQRRGASMNTPSREQLTALLATTVGSEWALSANSARADVVDFFRNHIEEAHWADNPAGSRDAFDHRVYTLNRPTRTDTALQCLWDDTAERWADIVRDTPHTTHHTPHTTQERTHMDTFTLTLGPKQYYHNTPIRHTNDYAQEILVDFDDGREGSLGWVSALHCVITGKLRGVAMVDTQGDALEGCETLYTSTEVCLDMAAKFLTNWLTA